MLCSVEVFRTSVPGARAAARLVQALRRRWPTWRITLDAQDVDRVLRVQTPAEAVPVAAVRAEVGAWGYLCEPLPDADEDDNLNPAASILCYRSSNSER